MSALVSHRFSFARAFAGSLVLGAVCLAVACGGSSSTSSSGSGSSNNTTSGSSSFMCCVNGAHFTCTSQASLDKCIMDPGTSGCTHTGTDDPNGMCN